MKNTTVKYLLNLIITGSLLTGSVPAVNAASNICSKGTGEPPFLSYGTESNLLMLLDNSGSMLDTAYIDTDTDGAGADKATQCFDDGYVPTDLVNEIIYAGPFTVYNEDLATNTKTETWFKYVEVQPFWEHKTYGKGERVYENGIIYEAITVTGNASTGVNIYDDPEVTWEPTTKRFWENNKFYPSESFVYNTVDGLLYFSENGGTSNESTADGGLPADAGITDWQQVSPWKNNVTYSASDYVTWDGIVYQTLVGGTSNGTKPSDDEDVFWIETDPFEWKTSRTYITDDIVTYQGMIFKALQDHTATGQTIYTASHSANWLRLDQGYYEEVSAADAQAVCTAGTGTKYTASGLCFTHLPVVGAPDRITSFTATGNLLNWLMASKFDIQKSILTGGKYNPDISRVISENRGCSGSKFVKQVTLDSGAGYLTLAVRGPRTKGDPNKQDRVDGTDDTTRIEVLAISSLGYDPAACQDAIDKILSHGLNGSQNEIDSCLSGTGTTADARTALNHAMQYCWQTNHTRNLNTIVKDCENVYSGLGPGDIDEWANAYNCYGIFDANKEHNVDRTGYAGRCYQPGTSSTGSTCDPYPRSVVTGCNWNVSDPCTWTEDKDVDGTDELYRNSSTEQYSEVCTQLNNAGDACQNNNKWDTLYTDSISSEPCDPNSSEYTGGGLTGADWSSDIDGTPTAVPPDAADTALLPGTLPFNNNTGLTDEAAYCFYEGMEDYCSDLLIPEVIDPTDQATSTSGDFGNIPALLVDSGVLNKLGIDLPIAVMRGHIKQVTPPQGILQQNASDLRIGAMAFNSVGAATECENANTSNLIEEYCPSTNRDGAELITPLRLGTLVGANGNTHVDDLASSINSVRATSWTPIAEAVYNAIGYYTQNTDMRLNNGDFQTDSDIVLGWQNNKYFPANAYILDSGNLYQTAQGGISNGTSRSDDSEVNWVIQSGYKGSWNNTASYVANDIVLHDGKLFFTVLGGTSVLKDEAAAQSLNSPLFDAGVTWEFLIDPVINYCQSNNILIITEGASTADINADVENFSLGNGSHAFNQIPIIDTDETTVDPDVANQCTDGLQGSTYVDDLTYFALDDQDQFNVYPTSNATLPETDFPFQEKPKNNITTYVVTAGITRDDNTNDECNPAYLMDKIANNGGTTSALKGESPRELEEKLLAVFNELRQRASAGSAASVISSARGGEGAIYQAIFWPELKQTDSAGTDYTVSWVGDVHGLFLDENGFIYEDTDGNRQLNPTEDLDGDLHLDCGEDVNCDGVLDITEDVDLDGILDDSEDLNGNDTFDVLADLDNDGTYDTGIDTNNDGIPDVSEDIDGDGHFDRINEDQYDSNMQKNGVLDGGDLRIVIFFDSTPGIEKSRACMNSSITDSLGQTCTSAKDLDRVHFIWSANQWLSDYPVLGAAPDNLILQSNRNLGNGSFNVASRQRHIFTWNDADRDGVVANAEVVDFIADADGGPVWDPIVFDAADATEVDNIIRWVRGQDFPSDPSFRSRQSLLRDPSTGNTYGTTWRLGDIIHSTPTTVTAPAEGYHLIYNDLSYARFLSRWGNRRHMVYFGANDGMLHAVNAGFYNSADAENKFYLGYDYTANTYNDSGPSLGTEMWAYVPYNLLPHLNCLTNPLYTHKYFVDLRPRVFDVQIFTEEPECTTDGKTSAGCKHPDGWGTILVGGMRFGGAPIDASQLTGGTVTLADGSVQTDTREFISSYFILDITDPEDRPKLLGELTSTNDPAYPYEIVDLGYSTVVPTMVIQKDASENNWYLVFGSGPHGDNALQGQSDQDAKISILPLSWIADGEPLRIPASAPSVDDLDDYGGTLIVPDPDLYHAVNNPLDSAKAFVSDPITVDFDINPSYEEYKSDAVYFGTVEGETDFSTIPPVDGFSTYNDGASYWNGGGRMYRLVMNPAGHTVGKTNQDAISNPSDWEINTMLNLGSTLDGSGQIVPQISGHPVQPITASSSIGTDGYNFWLYFGTGRFFDADDKTDRQQQSYYGIKEPMEIVLDVDGITKRRKLNWAEVELSGSISSAPGAKGLAKVDEILVGESLYIESAPLTCRDNTDPTGGPIGNLNCIQSLGSGTFYNSAENNGYFSWMERYIAGAGRCSRNNCTDLPTCTGSDYSDSNYKNNCTDGWRKDFWQYNNREKNVGQATLLGGLVTFTTYQPNSGVCQAEGNAYLYGVYYKTGTSWVENIFGENGIDNHDNVENKLSLGRGLATTPNLHVGSGDAEEDGPKAFVQTSTGEIKEIKQENLPISNFESGRTKWKEYNP